MSLSSDTDVLALFEQEASDRLGLLGEMLLRLEADGSDPELIASLFREAHTLKGAAVVVGLEAIGNSAHNLEEVLADVRAGVLEVNGELLDRLFSMLDDLASLAGVSAPQRGDAVDGNGSSTEVPGDRAGSAGSPTLRRETARVAVDRLDDLVRLAGEATAAHLRLAEVVRERLAVDPFSVSEMRALMRVLSDLQEGTLRARMLPVGAMTTGLRRAVRDAARRTGKVVRCEVRGEDTELDRHVHERLGDALLHLVRNAVDHGIESPGARIGLGKPEEGTVIVHAMQLGSRVIVTVTDDGAGIDVGAVRRRAAQLGIDSSRMADDEVHRLLFQPGFSTAAEVTDVSGRGVGLDAVRDSLAALRGRIEVTSTPGGGTRFRISVPITLTLLPGLLVRVGGLRYALPMSNVITILDAATPEVPVEGRPAVLLNDRSIPVVPLQSVLGTPGPAAGPVVVLSGIDRTLAVRVDSLAEQREVLVKSMPGIVPSNDLVVGASAEADGTVLLVLDAEAIVDAGARTRPVPTAPMHDEGTTAPAPRRGRILVVDDALTVRELQRTILTRAGYEVIVAVDGRDAFTKLEHERVDLVLTDLEMPELDGLSLCKMIREHPTLANLPIVILTSRGTDEDRRLGLEVGANAYIVKSAFDETALRDVVSSLLGEEVMV
jgi:two-component system chemotaxis sensor kinase CheA